ncbi:MAG: hypothetical protein KKA73_10180 [Chloroflexi bacterium]|nr:hypothetical protein [Chloroflexota bacterium]MBU1748044.1 hypothetical protein [Chloroflexota bacterium]
MNTKSTLGSLIILLALAALTGLALNVHVRARAATAPAGTLVPLGPAQTDAGRRAAYTAVFQHLYADGSARLATGLFAYEGTDYDPGTLLLPPGFDGAFAHVAVTGTQPFTPALALHYKPVAVFWCTLHDASGYYTSEAARYEGLFTADYLNGADRYHDVLDEANIATGDLDDYAVLLLPGIKIGHAQDVADALGPAGLAAIRAFVERGGMVYAQSDGCYLVEAAGLVAPGTVDLTARVTAYGTGSVGQLDVLTDALPLTWSWLDDSAYVLDDPVLAGGGDLTTIATYADTTQPGTAAILYRQFPGGGQVILMSGHPAADRAAYYPQFLAALFQAFADRGDLRASVRQIYTADPAVPDDLIPAREPDVPVLITAAFENVSAAPLADVVLTETVQAGFHLSGTLPTSTWLGASLTPTITAHDGVTDVVWTVGVVAPGQTFTVAFPAYTVLDTMNRSSATVAVGRAAYSDTVIGRVVQLTHPPLVIRSELAARLFGDRDIEPDRRFLIPQDGNFLDVYHTYENKEEGLAQHVRVVEIIPLVVPIVDLEDQTEFLDPNDGETIWVTNEPFFYDEPSYPRPVGLADWPAKTPISLITATQHLTGVQIVWITYTVPGGVHIDPPPTEGYGNFITIPPTYSAYITVTADYQMVVPALRLEWELGPWPGYHYEEPAVRYGLRSRELLGRDVYFDETPRANAVTIQYPGGSVYTLVGGDPVFYRERLTTGEVVYWPEAGGDSSHLYYEDRWGRPHTLPLRSAFYDVFDADSCYCGLGGPGELHIGLAGTFEVRVDQDEDGIIEDHERVLEYPSKLPADVEWLVKTQGRIAISAEETLLDIAIPRPYRTQIVPEGGTWGVAGVSYDVESGWAVFESLTETNTLTHLFFRVSSDGHTPTAIRLYGHLVPYPDYAPDNVAVKLAEGPFFTYHQTYAGPSRYEAIFGHVQGIRAHAKNVSLGKEVSPNLLSLHGDEFYYILHVHDRDFADRYISDPYFASYGFDTLAGTTYVGGREDMDLLHSVVAPGEYTQIRIEVDNNSGITLTNVAIAPDLAGLPAGVAVTRITANDVPPQFPDLPFLNVTAIPDAWRGNYYFRLEVGPDFPADQRGRALEIPFTITADGLPPEFQLPPAMFGVPDDADEVRNDHDRVGQLVITDTFPLSVTVTAARIANHAEMTDLTNLVRDDERLAALDYFSNTLRTDVIASHVGATYTFTPTGPAATFPWDDGPNPNGDLYVIARAVLPDPSGPAGRYAANEGFWFRFHEEEGRTWTVGPSNPAYVYIHGAYITTTYTVAGITHVFNGASLDELFPGEANLVTVTMRTANDGDRLALGLTVTTTVPASVTVVSAWGQAGITPVIVDGQHVAWPIGNLREGAAIIGGFVLQATPPLSGTVEAAGDGYVHPAVTALRLTTASHARFVDEFSERLLRVERAERTAADVSPAKLPAPLLLTAAWSGDATIYLAWDSVAGPGVRYHVYRSADSHAGYRWVGVAHVPSFYDATAQPGQRYYYVVVAVDDATGEGLHSPVALVGRSPYDVFLPLISRP